MTSRDLYKLLQQVPNGVLLRVGEIGTNGNLCLEFVVDGEPTDVCPLVEITPKGTFVEQVAKVKMREIGPIEALKDEMGS